MILTTHYMEEAERLCDYIVIMDNGKILQEGSLGTLLTKATDLDELFVSLTGRRINE
jgi:ABC-type multidrug transport system ATPase subunit